MKIIVHLGMPKTGSSSIQRTLHKNKEKFTQIYLPDFGNEGNHQRPLNHIFGSKKGGSDNSAIKKRNRHLKRVEQLFDDNLAKGRDILLSGETLCKNLTFNEIKQFHDFLKQYSKNINAFAYIRPPKSYIESAFQQTLKYAVMSKHKKVTDVTIKGRFPHYRSLFEKFDQIFGIENVNLYKFDPSAFPNNCVVTDFCQKLGINIPSNLKIIRINESLSLGSISLLYAYLREGGTSSFANRSLIDLLCKFQDGSKLRFSSEIMAPILKEYHSEIDWIENRADITLSEDIYKDDKYAIRSKSELLNFSPETLQWLSEQLGGDYPLRMHPNMTSKEIAQWMNQLITKYKYL